MKIKLITIILLLFLIFVIYTIKNSRSITTVSKLSKTTPIPRIKLTKYSLIELHRGIPPVVEFTGDLVRGQQHDNYYFNILKNKIIADNLSAKVWFEDKCNQFWLSDDPFKKGEFKIERHERHIEECTGADPMFSPLLDMFVINKKIKRIFWIDIINSKYLSYEEWSKTISK